jgi:hypothetical protein
LSRRLGDDPLARARSERAKAAQASASAATDSAGQASVQSVIQSSSRASYNDVFFKRRAEGAAPQQVEALRAPEVPEISEISEIPEIREVAAAAPSFQASPAVAAEVIAAPAAIQSAEVLPAPPVSFIAEVVSKLNSSVAATEVKGETASLPPASQVTADTKDEAKPEPAKSGGFFKRLFGKFK